MPHVVENETIKGVIALVEAIDGGEFASPLECSRSELLGYLTAADYCYGKLQSAIFEDDEAYSLAIENFVASIGRDIGESNNDFGHLLSNFMFTAGENLYSLLIHSGAIGPIEDGVGLYIFNEEGQMLLGERTGSHGAGQWGAAGGHCDDDTPQVAAIKEALEEIGTTPTLYPQLVMPTLVMFSNEKKKLFRDHFIAATIDEKPRVMEPNKCLQWKYFEPTDMPSPLFFPLENIIERGLDLTELAANVNALRNTEK